MEAVLDEIRDKLRAYLRANLPRLRGSDWEKSILEELNQRRDRARHSLFECDLADLLSISIASWDRLGHRSADKHIAHEALQVRNRWAHRAGAESSDDKYRALDTLYRLLCVLKISISESDNVVVARREAASALAAKPTAPRPHTSLPAKQIISSRAPLDISALRALLLQKALLKEAITYGEVLRHFDMPVHQGTVGALVRVLNLLGEQCQSRSEPILSVLVVNKKERVPGEGFFELMARLGRSGQTATPHSRQRLVEEETQKCFERAPRLK